MKFGPQLTTVEPHYRPMVKSKMCTLAHISVDTILDNNNPRADDGEVMKHEILTHESYYLSQLHIVTLLHRILVAYDIIVLRVFDLNLYMKQKAADKID